MPWRALTFFSTPRGIGPPFDDMGSGLQQAFRRRETNLAHPTDRSRAGVQRCREAALFTSHRR
jgi:hypothetical protein